jgi:hypothetical protein
MADFYNSYKIVDNQIVPKKEDNLFNGLPMKDWTKKPRICMSILYWNDLAKEEPIEFVSISCANIIFRLQGYHNLWRWGSVHQHLSPYKDNHNLFRGSITEWLQWVRKGSPNQWTKFAPVLIPEDR